MESHPTPTHLIFHLVKATEVVSGILLLADVVVPFALILSYPVAVIAFVVDVFLMTHLRARVMGAGILFNTSFLMAAYYTHYRSILVFKSLPDLASHIGGIVTEPYGAWHPTSAPLDWILKPTFRRLLEYVAWVAVVWGTVMIMWLMVMIVQHLALSHPL